MYEQHFNLSDKPFRLTPEVALRFPQPKQQVTLNTLRLALQEGEGFVKVVGEVGLGKTLLCRALLSELEAPFKTAWIPDPQLSPGSLRAAIAKEFAIVHPARASLRELHERLQAGLMEMAGAGLRPVLIVDEAQALPDRTLEAIRLLTNLETERRKLLQVVLFGQPELDARLHHPQFRQLRQRVTFSCRLTPLSPSEVAGYIQFRSARAGARKTLFTPLAMRRIARASGGVPRLVNVLCHKALLAAWGRGGRHAGIGDVGRAIADTESLDRPWPGRIARLAALAVVVVCSWVLLRGLSGGGP